jgi:uncharacterized radical SAM superfamily Fe-S cluster-containing enzyme
MHLTAYLEDVKETPAAFARRINVSSVAIHRYLHKGRIPEPDVMAKIVEQTQGRVRPDDFYNLAPPVRRARRRSAEG